MDRPRGADGGTLVVPAVGLLLFASGCCALIYQIAWLRMLRLVFGASTAASAAVLAIFMGGLGFGGVFWGRRADRAANALLLYAKLELGVALAAAASVPLILLVRAGYLGAGGTLALGAFGGTTLRLVLSALVLGLPTFCMGGTLPAAVRAVEDGGDVSRRSMGRLYGLNTLGAVAGTLWATFLSLELLGTTVTLYTAVALNVAVAVAAVFLGRRVASAPTAAPSAAQNTSEAQRALEPPGARLLLLGVAGVAGFSFLLMELVWYRMLAPLLGGSVYCFGMILAAALLGIGVGGVLYAVRTADRRPSLTLLALTCMLEAACIALPYAAGDRVAILTMVLRPLGFVGLVPTAFTWLCITLLVVFPAAVVSGYQLPVVVGLLGAGAPQVGRDVGSAYAWNTAGAIVGSLAGGFGLLPLLSAPVAWKWVALLMLLAGVLVLLAALRRGARPARCLAPALFGLLTLWMCHATGPTAFWRHSGIGAGELLTLFRQPNDVQELLNIKRHNVAWQADGVESSVALDVSDAYNFIVNGKSDGSALGDAQTQVMSGMIPTLLLPHPQRVLVIGLGTGSTAGWLAQVPSIEDVDVVELEPSILHVAQVCAPVNHDVLANPKVHVIIGDGREFLLTTKNTYDLIFSEPSNPYRAGVASLLTREFYQAAAARLRPDGMMAQWVQAYNVHPDTLKAVYATVTSVFPWVETWEVMTADLLLVARQEKPVHDAALIRSRVDTEPYRSALGLVWGVNGIEGLYSGYVGNAGLAQAISKEAAGRINTDDHTFLEFEFARTVGRHDLNCMAFLRDLAQKGGYTRPEITGTPPDWDGADELTEVRRVRDGQVGPPFVGRGPRQARSAARRAYVTGNLAQARQAWSMQTEEPTAPMDVTMVAELLADAASPQAWKYIEALRPTQPAETEAFTATWLYRARHPFEALEHLLAAFQAYQQDPWTYRPAFKRTFDLAWQLASAHNEMVEPIFAALDTPFAVRALETDRLTTRVNLAFLPGHQQLCVKALAGFEPNVPWEEDFLRKRAACYRAANHPLAAQAQRDLDRFLANTQVQLRDPPPAT